METTINPSEMAAKLKEFWSPRVVGEVNDAYIKVARLKGQLVWHKHEDEDELFLVLKGKLRIELEDRGSVELTDGEFFVVPKGILHNPIADKECHVLLVERKTTKHTGNVMTEMTRSIEEQLKPM